MGIFEFTTHMENTALYFANVSGTISHQNFANPIPLQQGRNNFPYSGTYTIKGTFHKVSRIGRKTPSPFENGSVDRWEDTETEHIDRLFERSNLSAAASPPPTVKIMSRVFLGAQNIPDITGWDVSNVERMTGMFQEAITFNQCLNSWDFGNVKDMRNMFQRANFFNNGDQPLTWNTPKLQRTGQMFEWALHFDQSVNPLDTSNVVAMQYMFRGATDFTNGGEPLRLNTSKVKNMRSMFEDTRSFDQSLNYLDTSNVTTMQDMFKNTRKFNNGGEPLTIDTSKVKTMYGMFKGTRRFNQSLNNLDTRNVYNMGYMFYQAYMFQNGYQPLTFDTSNVTNMSYMFAKSNFNQDVTAFDTSAVRTMDYMFFNNYKFDQPLASWDTSSVTTMEGMFHMSKWFDQDISAWDVSAVESMKLMFAHADSFNNGGMSLAYWDTSSLRHVKGMFQRAFRFNQDVGTWNMGLVEDFSNMFQDAVSFQNGGMDLQWDFHIPHDSPHLFWNPGQNTSPGAWKNTPARRARDMFGSKPTSVQKTLQQQLQQHIEFV